MDFEQWENLKGRTITVLEVSGVAEEGEQWGFVNIPFSLHCLDRVKVRFKLYLHLCLAYVLLKSLESKKMLTR